MKYYLSAIGSCEDRVFENNTFKTILSSFAVDAKKILPLLNDMGGYDVMVDSGAFSALGRGIVINIDEYLGFIQQFPEEWYYINLDVMLPRNATEKEIRNCEEQGYENYLYLSKKVKNLLPVYHYGEDIKVFKRYCELSDYVCINMNKKGKKGIDKDDYLSEIFSISRDKVKVHGLAITSIPLLYRYPFYSADSISYQRGAVFEKQKYWAHGKLKAILYQSLRDWKYLEQQITNLWKERGIIWT